MIKLHTFIFLFLTMIVVHAQGWHTFTNKRGSSFVGSLMEVNGDRVKIMRKSDAGVFTVGLSNLSEEDQRYVRNHKKNKSAPALKTEISPKSVPSPRRTSLPQNTQQGPLLTRTRDEIEAHIREINARPAPSWARQDQREALALLNVYRYLCGAPDNVLLNEAESKHVAEVLATWAAMGDKPGTPEFVNKLRELMMIPTGHLSRTVKSSISSGSSALRKTLRPRWNLLQEGIEEVGIGAHLPRSAIKMGKGYRTHYSGNISYPGSGYFPLKYLHSAGWTFHTKEVLNKAETVTVDVYRLHEMPATHSELEAMVLRSERLLVNDVYRYANTVIFEPKYPRTGDYVKEAGIYAVVASSETLRKSYLVILYE